MRVVGTYEAKPIAGGNGDWGQGHNPAVGVRATTTKAAGGVGVKHVCRAISWTIACAATPQAAVMIIALRDGATGVGAVLFVKQVILPANGQWEGNLTDLEIIGSDNTAMTLEFVAAGVADAFQSVSLSGYDTLP